MQTQAQPQPQTQQQAPRSGSSVLTLVLAWLAVGIPLLWGVEQTLAKSMALFQ
jgi:hypothetical protein